VPLEGKLGKLTRCRYDRLNPGECYLVCNGLNLFLWVGSQVSEQFVQNVFHLDNVMMVSSENCSIQYGDENDDVVQVRDSIALVRSKYSFGHYLRLMVVRQGDMAVEEWFKSAFLVEDESRRTQQAKSYETFLCKMHSQVREVMES